MIKKKEEKVEIQKLVKTNIKVPIKGITPMLQEKMDMSVVQTYDDKKSLKVVKKDTRSEKDKMPDKIHYTENGNVGFPARGFMNGMIEVAPKLDIYKKDVRGSVRINGYMIPIDFDEQVVNEDWGRQSGISKAPLLIIRPEFRGWSCELDITFNSSVLSTEQIINLVNYAGFHQGVGSFRPEKGGTYGQYEVET